MPSQSYQGSRKRERSQRRMTDEEFYELQGWDPRELELERESSRDQCEPNLETDVLESQTDSESENNEGHRGSHGDPAAGSTVTGESAPTMFTTMMTKVLQQTANQCLPISAFSDSSLKRQRVAYDQGSKQKDCCARGTRSCKSIHNKAKWPTKESDLAAFDEVMMRLFVFHARCHAYAERESTSLVGMGFDVSSGVVDSESDGEVLEMFSSAVSAKGLFDAYAGAFLPQAQERKRFVPWRVDIVEKGLDPLQKLSALSFFKCCNVRLCKRLVSSGSIYLGIESHAFCNAEGSCS